MGKKLIWLNLITLLRLASLLPYIENKTGEITTSLTADWQDAPELRSKDSSFDCCCLAHQSVGRAELGTKTNRSDKA